MQIAKSTVIKWSKWTLIVVAGIVALLALAAFVLTSVVDPNRYRGKVEAIVADLAGRPFVIEGDLKITWFPWLGVKVGPAHFNDRPAGGTLAQAATATAPSSQPLLEWQSASVAAKLLPLLKGQVVVDRVRVEKPHLRLRRDASGNANWDDLGPTNRHSQAQGPSATQGPSAAQLRPPAPGTAAPQPAHASPPPEIAGIEITDGELDYLDEAPSGLHLTLTNWQLQTGEWRPGAPFEVHTRFVAHSESITTAEGVPVQIDAPELTTQLEPFSVTTPKLTLQVADAQLEGPLTVQTTATGGATPSGKMAAPTASTPAQQSPAPNTISANGSLTIHAPAVRKLASTFNLEQYLPKDPTTLGKLDSSSTWSFKNGALSVVNLHIELDGTRFDGWLAHTAPPQSAWRFELHGDRIDLGRYTDINTNKRRSFDQQVKALRAFNANGTLKFDQVQLADTHMNDVSLRFETPEQHQ